ncbi:MAG: hypothetical protein IJT82_07925 [Schwartzia sp.]|nr:hypothetical protein [Schwartzia sp. (in: firmicutes)]
MNEPTNSFYSDERLFRAVPIGHPVMFDKNGNVTSAIFQDSQGVSVDREWHRSTQEAVETLRKRLSQIKGKEPSDYRVISVTKADCDSIGAVCVYAPEQDNAYHSLIERTAEIPKLTKGQARALVKLAQLVY